MSRSRRRDGDAGFSLVEVLVSVAILGMGGVAVLGAAAAAARGAGDHREVADAQSVAAAAADALTGIDPVSCDDASAAYSDAVGTRLDQQETDRSLFEILQVQSWDPMDHVFKTCDPKLPTPQLVTLRVTSADGSVAREVQAMTASPTTTTTTTTTTTVPETDPPVPETDPTQPTEPPGPTDPTVPTQPSEPTTTTTTAAPTTTTVPPAVLIGNPLVYADSPFAMVSFGDTTMNGSFHVWGAAAIGGNLRFTGGAETGHNGAGTFKAPGESTATGLLVGNQIDFAGSSGQLKVLTGWVHVGDLSNGGATANGNILRVAGTSGSAEVLIQGNGGTSQSGAAASVQRSGLYDFAAAFDAFQKTSTALGELPGACADAAAARFVDQNGNPVSSGNAWWQLQAGKVNVLTITSAQLAAMGSVNNGSVSPNSNTPLIINITDTAATLSKGSITQNWSKYVIWNFPNATSVTINGLVGGSVYAPRAAVTLSGEVRGTIIADTLSGGNEVKWADNVPDIRSINCERAG